MKTKVILTAIAAAVSLGSTGVEATGNNLYSGRATVVKTNVLGINITVADTGPLPSTGGSIDKSNPGVDIPGVLESTLLTARTSGIGNTAKSFAEVADLDLLSVAGRINVTGNVINAQTKATCDASKRARVTGGSQIAFLEINGTPIEVTGDPNQTVNLLDLPDLPVPLPFTGLNQVVTLVINEQQKTQPARNKAEIKVNAIHLTVRVPNGPTLADVVVSHAKSDITCR